jgi:hypothetical protein
MHSLLDPIDRAAIHARLSRVTPQSERRWGRMSAHGMLCHLADSYGVPLAEKIASPATGLLQRTLLKFVALHTSVPWSRGFPTRPEIAQESGGTQPTNFAADRAWLLSIFERFCSSTSLEAAIHPNFGPLTRAEWLRWGFAHADHHLRQFGC